MAKEPFRLVLVDEGIETHRIMREMERTELPYIIKYRSKLYLFKENKIHPDVIIVFYRTVSSLDLDEELMNKAREMLQRRS